MYLKIGKNQIFQYLSIYLCLLLSGSRYWSITRGRNINAMHIIEICIIGVFLWCMLYNRKKYRFDYSILIIALLSFAIIFVRLSVGGVGIEVLIEWATYISIATIAVLSNLNKFIERFLRVVFFIAVISIVCYLFQIFQPSLLKLFLQQYDSNFSYGVWGNGYNGELFAYHAWGKFLFTFDEMHQYKNVGIFSEPGCYQIVLNSALFMLLFLPKHIGDDINNKKVLYFTVFSVAIATCQSTTGYIGYFAILILYILNRTDEGNRMRNRILLILLVLLIALILEYSVNGVNSLFYTAIIDKLISDAGDFSVTAGSGIYRVNTIITCLSSMLSHPFGVGYDSINALIDTSWSDGGAGAVLLGTGAALGIPALIIIIVWTLYPAFKSLLVRFPEKILIAFLFFNTALAQSEEFYATFIVIPIYLYAMRVKRNGDSDDVLGTKGG